MPARRGTVSDVQDLLADDTLSNEEKLAKIATYLEDESCCMKQEMDELVAIVKELRDIDIDKMLSQQLLMLQKTCACYVVSIEKLQKDVAELKEEVAKCVTKETVEKVVQEVIALSKLVTIDELDHSLSVIRSEMFAYQTKVQAAEDTKVREEAEAKLQAEIDLINQKLKEVIGEIGAVAGLIEAAEKHAREYTDSAVAGLRSQLVEETEKRVKADGELENRIASLRSEHRELINKNAADIATNASNIANLNMTVADLTRETTASVERLDKKIDDSVAELDGKISKNTQDIASNIERLNKIEGHVPEVDASIEDLVNKTNDHEARITKLEEEEVDHEARIASNTERIEKIEPRLTGAEEAIVQNTADHKIFQEHFNSIDSLLAEMSTSSEEIRKLKQAVFGVDEKCCDKSSIQSRLAAFEDRINNIWSKIADIPSLAGFKDDFEKLKAVVGDEKSEDSVVFKLLATIKLLDTLRQKVNDEVDPELKRIAEEITRITEEYTKIEDFEAFEALVEETYAKKTDIPVTDDFVTHEEFTAYQTTVNDHFTDVENDIDDKTGAVKTALTQRIDSVETIVNNNTDAIGSNRDDIAELYSLVNKTSSPFADVWDDPEAAKEMIAVLNADIAYYHKEEDFEYYASNVTGNRYVIESNEVPDSIYMNFVEPENKDEIAILSVPDAQKAFIPKYVFCIEKKTNAKAAETKPVRRILRTVASAHKIENLTNLEEINLDAIEYVVAAHNFLAGCEKLHCIVFTNLLYMARSHNFCAGCGALAHVVLPKACAFEKFVSEKNYKLQFLEEFIQPNNYTYDDEEENYKYTSFTADQKTAFIDAIITNIKKEDPDFNIDITDPVIVEKMDEVMDFVTKLTQFDNVEKRKDAMDAIKSVLKSFNISGTADLSAILHGVIEQMISGDEGATMWEDAQYNNIMTAFTTNVLNLATGLDITTDAKKNAFVDALFTAIDAYFEEQSKSTFSIPSGSSEESAWLSDHFVSFPAHFLKMAYTGSGLSAFAYIQFGNYKKTNFQYRPINDEHYSSDIFENLEAFENDKSLRTGKKVNFRLMRVYDKDGNPVADEELDKIKILDSADREYTLRDMQSKGIEPASFVQTTENKIIPQDIIKQGQELQYPDMDKTWEDLLDENGQPVKDEDEKTIRVPKEELLTQLRAGVLAPYVWDVRRKYEGYEMVVIKDQMYVIQYSPAFEIFSYVRSLLPSMASEKLIPTTSTKFTYDSNTYYYRFNPTDAATNPYVGTFTVYDKENPMTGDIPTISQIIASKEEYSILVNADIGAAVCVVTLNSDKADADQSNVYTESACFIDDLDLPQADWKRSTRIDLLQEKGSDYTPVLTSCTDDSSVTEAFVQPIGFGTDVRIRNPDYDADTGIYTEEQITAMLTPGNWAPILPGNDDVVAKSKLQETGSTEAGAYNEISAAVDALDDPTSATDDETIQALIKTKFYGGAAQPGNYPIFVQSTPQGGVITANSRACLLTYYKDYDYDDSDPANPVWVMKRYARVIPDYIRGSDNVTHYHLNTSDIPLTSQIVYTNDATTEKYELSANGLLLAPLIALSRIFLGQEIREQFGDTDSLIRGFLGKKVVFDNVLYEDVNKFYRNEVVSNLASGNLTTAQFKHIVELNYMMMKALNRNIENCPDYVIEHNDKLAKRSIAVSTILYELRNTYSTDVKEGYNDTTKTFADYFGHVDDDATFWRFIGFMIRNYTSETDRKLVAAAYFMAYRKFVGEFTDKSDKLLSSPEWKVMESLYDSVEDKSGKIALKNDHTCKFNGLLITGDKAGGLAYGEKTNVHMIPFGESNWSAEVAFPSEASAWSWFDSVNINTADDGKKTVTIVLKYLDATTNKFVKSEAITFNLTPAKYADAPGTAKHTLAADDFPATSTFVADSGIDLTANPIVFQAVADDEFPDEITMYRRRMNTWANTALGVFAGQGEETVIDKLIFNNTKLLDIKPFSWANRVKPGPNSALQIFAENSATKLPTESTITEPAMGVVLANIAPSNNDAQLYKQEAIIRAQFSK